VHVLSWRKTSLVGAELVVVEVVADLTLGTGVPSSAALAVLVVREAAVPSSPRCWSRWSRWPASSRWSRT
jgi:hypothetical protein